MGHVDTRVLAESTLHYGLAPYRQLIEAGLSPSQIKARVRRGLLISVHRTVYRLVGHPESFEQRCLAAVFATDGRAAVSHRSAAALHGWCAPPATVDLIHPDATDCRVSGVRWHRSAGLREVDSAKRDDGILVTTPARTLLDLGIAVPRSDFFRIVELALIDKQVTVRQLTVVLAKCGGRGVPGTAALRDFLRERTASSAGVESRLERILLRIIEKGRLAAPVLQHPLRLRSGREIRFDAAYPALRIGLETDGRRWHERIEDKTKDRKRDRTAAGLDWLTLRFTAEDLREPERVASDIAAAIEARSG